MTKVTEKWVGYRGGEVVANYKNRAAADTALTRREVEAVSPAHQYAMFTPEGDREVARRMDELLPKLPAMARLEAETAVHELLGDVAATGYFEVYDTAVREAIYAAANEARGNNGPW